MVGIYNSVGGESVKTHIHSLVAVRDDPEGYRWRCTNCAKKLMRKSGVVVDPLLVEQIAALRRGVN